MATKKIQELRLRLRKLIAERVKLARESAGYKNQESLAEAIGLSRQAVSAIESGKSIPASDTLFLIAEATGQPLEFFYSAVSTLVRASDRLEQKLDQILRILEQSKERPSPRRP
jgi:transcriptional regulator with XRE-family HTH domain